MKPRFKLHLDGRLSVVQGLSCAAHDADWHSADVIAALRKRGISLRKLAAQHGYSHIQRVLTSPWLAAEKIVADALGVAPHVIWPSRYAGADRSRARSLTRKFSLQGVGRSQ